MKVGVVGAGAVGCYYGSQLAHAGVPVTFIAKEAHAQVIRDKGLACDINHSRIHLYPSVSSDFSALEGVDVVLVCVKTFDNEGVGQKIAPYLGTTTQVLSLQNGVETAEHLSRYVEKTVISAIVYTATQLVAPGHVVHHGGHDIVLDHGLRDSDIAALFLRSGFLVQFSENLRKALWEKLTVNCACNALSAVLRKPYGQFLATDVMIPVVRSLVEECRAVAGQVGIDIPETILDRILNLSHTMPTQYSSMAHDIMNGKKTEVDALNGFVMRTGEAVGISTPANRLLWGVVTSFLGCSPSLK